MDPSWDPGCLRLTQYDQVGPHFIWLQRMAWRRQCVFFSVGLPWISMRHRFRVLRVLGCSLQPKKRWKIFKLSCLRIEMLKLQSHGIWCFFFVCPPKDRIPSKWFFLAYKWCLNIGYSAWFPFRWPPQLWRWPNVDRARSATCCWSILDLKSSLLRTHHPSITGIGIRELSQPVDWVVVSYIFYVHPHFWGRWTHHFDLPIFLSIGFKLKPPTSWWPKIIWKIHENQANQLKYAKWCRILSNVRVFVEPLSPVSTF